MEPCGDAEQSERCSGGVRGRERRSEATGTANRPFECGGKTRTQTTHSGGMTKEKNSERVKGLRAPSLALAYEDWTSPQAASPIDKTHCYFKEGFEILPGIFAAMNRSIGVFGTSTTIVRMQSRTAKKRPSGVAARRLVLLLMPTEVGAAAV